MDNKEGDKLIGVDPNFDLEEFNQQTLDWANATIEETMTNIDGARIFGSFEFFNPDIDHETAVFAATSRNGVIFGVLIDRDTGVRIPAAIKRIYASGLETEIEVRRRIPGLNTFKIIGGGLVPDHKDRAIMVTEIRPAVPIMYPEGLTIMGLLLF